MVRASRPSRPSPRRRAALLLAAIAAAALPAPAFAQDARRDEAPPPPPKPKLTSPPALLEAAAPDYPPAALAAGKQADVRVRLHIDAAGAVTQVEVVTPVGDGFDDAAVAAAKQYRFRPAEFDGKPGPIVVETVIHFVIEQQVETVEEPPPEPPSQPSAPGHAGDATRPVTIRGEAIQRGDRRRLAGVIVSIRELGLDAVTDDEGRFYFHGVAPGRYTIIAVDDRHDRFERPIFLEKKEALELRLWMRPRGGNPYETVVEGEREVLEVTRRTLQREQLTSVPGTFGDPIRVIQTLPGLARPPFVLGILIVRGSNPDDTGIFLDGHRIPLIFHFLGGPSILNANFVESLDLYPGGFPARFGRGHGGVVAVESRPSKSDGIHGAADVDLLDSSAYVRAPLTKKISVAAAGRRSYIDVFLPLVLPEPSPGSTQIVVPVYYDWQARVDGDLGREGRVSVFAIGSSDQLDVLSEDADDEVSLDLNSQVDFFRVIGTYKRPLAGDLALTISPAFGRDSITFSGGQAQASGPFTSLEVTENTLSYRARVMGRLARWAVLDTGLDLESRVTRYDANLPIAEDIRNQGGVDVPPQLITQTSQQLEIGVHADVAVDLGRLRLIPGLRLDLYSLDGEERVSADPRIVARWGLGQGWTAKAYTGVFHQPPQPEAFDSRFGNPKVGIELGLHYGIGAEWKPSRLWLLDTETYYVARRNQVAFTNRVEVQPDGSVDPVRFDNRGFSDTYGLEVLIKREISDDAYGWLSYTYSHTRRRTNAFESGETGTVPYGLDQPHTLNAVASWKPGDGWELGARFQLSSGRPETPVTGATLDADDGSYEPQQGRALSTRRPYFHQLDVRAEKVWLFDTWKLGLYLDILNVLNTENAEATQWDYRFREKAPVSGVPFVPTLGIRGEW